MRPFGLATLAQEECQRNQHSHDYRHREGLHHAHARRRPPGDPSAHVCCGVPGIRVPARKQNEYSRLPAGHWPPNLDGGLYQ